MLVGRKIACGSLPAGCCSVVSCAVDARFVDEVHLRLAVVCCWLRTDFSGVLPCPRVFECVDGEVFYVVMVQTAVQVRAAW